MHRVYFYHQDKEAAQRNSIGLLFVRDEKSSFDVLFECREYSSFFRSIANGFPQQGIELKKPRIIPLTLIEICRLNMIDLVDGVLQIHVDNTTHIRIK